jgi:predicted phage terminase large subunit-like protein
MVTAGVGGRIIGLGGDLICIDDPTKNWEEAYSKVQRDAAWDWWQGTLMSRREPGAKMLLTMSRWHVDDIVGRLLKGDQGLRIKVIHMPALAEENDVLGRKPGEPLVPDRYNEKDYETIRKAVGNRVWAAQFQQNPLPESGQILNAKKVRHYQPNRTNGELQYPLQDVTFSERDCVRIAVMDTAQTIKKSSDYTAIGIYDITPHSDVVLVDMLRLKAESPDHFALLEHAEATYQPAYFVIEREKGSIPLIQEAQRRGKAVVEINPIGDKRLRGMQAAPKIEAGKFWVPHGAPWVGDFMEELASYPSGVHDDMADTAVYAILHTNQANLAGKKPIRRDLSTPWSRFVSAAFAVKKENKDSDLMGRM